VRVNRKSRIVNGESSKTMRPRAVFLDRDGTLNVEKNYLFRVEDWEWLPGAIEAIQMLNQLGFQVVVVTNQAGIARGLYSVQDLERLHAWVNEDLSRHGATIDAYYFCPHHPDFGVPCSCRKPEPGLLFRAAQERGIDLARSFLVGDKATDILAGIAAGCVPFLLASGYGERERGNVPPNVPLLHSLLDLPRLLAG
jgi:D-glycero-D-manno-heptose 1,7-bisphosphate phosphatase